MCDQSKCIGRFVRQTGYSILLGCLASIAGGPCLGVGQTVDVRLGGRCVEEYLAADVVHGATDYGVAINAAVRARKLVEPSELELCGDGNHAVFTPIVIDRPVTLVGHASVLVAQGTLARPMHVVEGAEASGGSRTLRLLPGSSLEVGEAVGGTGLATGSTVVGRLGDVAELSLPARLVLRGRMSSSTTITGVNTLAGLRVGQRISCAQCVDGTRVLKIDRGKRLVLLSKEVTTAVNSGVNRKIVISEFTIEDSWIVPVTSAVMAAPMILFRHNAAALHNSEGQMVGGGVRDLTIADRGNGGRGRSLSGVQGVQVCGWDMFTSHNLRVEGLAGSGIILGGCGTVRESQFVETQVRDSGDWRTGQASIVLLTGYAGHPVDEINQVAFVGGGATFNYGVGVLIGTQVPAERPSGGPRMLWFESNFQVENGSHEHHGAGSNTGQPVDEIEIQRAVDVYFRGVSIAAPGFGHALISAESVESLTVSESRLYAAGKGTSYTVETTRGSPLVRVVRGGSGSFEEDGLWRGNGVGLDGPGCKPVCLTSISRVAADGLSLSLAEPYGGDSSNEVAMEVRGGGYYFALGAGTRKVTALGNTYNDASALTSALLSLEPAESFLVGPGAATACVITDYTGYGGLTISGPKCRLTLGAGTSPGPP